MYVVYLSMVKSWTCKRMMPSLGQADLILNEAQGGWSNWARVSQEQS